MAFYDREDELAALERRWRDGDGEFFILWGRRRVGKTELLTRFMAGKRALLLEATDAVEADHLADLTALVAEVAEGDLLATQPLQSWQAGLAAIADIARSGQVLVVLDEFQRIAIATPEIGSLLNRWWRTTGRNLPVFLILSGSEVSFFERNVLTGPTYGRRTGQQRLDPFGYRNAALFFPGYSPEDRLRAWAVLGGMPYYLEQFDSDRSIGCNILGTILYREGVLREEARLLLHEELPDPARYASILRAIAGGCTRHNEISRRTRIDAIDPYLRTLQRLFIITRRVPVTAANPERTRQVTYAIADGYLRFHYRFVAPFESRLVTNARAEQHLEQVVLPQLDQFVSADGFETACREYLAARDDVADVGRWWGQVREAGRWVSRELDAVAVAADRSVVAVGGCKWTAVPTGTEEDDTIGRLLAHIPGAGPTPPVRYHFSRTGFTEGLKRRAAQDPTRIRLVRPTDMFA